MAWDRARYLTEVLEPARKAGNVPPADLYVRYGLQPGPIDATAFADQVRDVVGYWRELRIRRKTYARLADTLIAAHGELERTGQLTPRGFAARLARDRRENIGRLSRLAETEAGAATHVGPATVARLRSAVSGGVTDAEVVAALRTAGIRVVAKFPALPATPHPKQADLTKHLAPLGRWLSAEVIFGDDVARGFRVLDGFVLADGRALDETAISQARARVQARRFSDPARVASENVIAVLGAAARQPGELNALLLAEVIGRLRQFASSGFVQKGITTQAAELGLEYEEAGLLAAAILAPGTHDTLRQQITSALSAGRLRSAQELAAELPPGERLRDRIADLDAKVCELTRRADGELAREQPEQAARLLTEALGLARDDAGLAGRLKALAPPSPRTPVIRLNGNHVSVAWAPSPALAGQICYRIMRGEGLAPRSTGDGTAVVTRTAQCFVSDLDAPPGTELFYSIFASRDGDVWSAPAVTPAATFTPELTGLTVQADATSVTASWQLHPAAEGVRVTRRTGRPPDGPEDGTPVPALPTGFTDAGLQTGTEYYYRIVTCYRSPDGQRRDSAGTITRAAPEPLPQAVTDLDVSVNGDDNVEIVARWTPPGHGQVRLVLLRTSPPWPAGGLLRPDEAAGLPPVPGDVRRDPDGRYSVRLQPPRGPHHLLAVTVGRNAAIAGNGVEVHLAEPVHDLCARRMHDEVSLSWVWPDEATDALVRWMGREQTWSRRSYHDDGGVMITVGPAATAIEVRALYPQPGGQLAAPGATAHVPGRPVAVPYRIRRAGRRHPRRRVVELSAERSADLPALVVVESDGTYAPGSPDEGEPVQRIGPQPITPDRPVTIPAEATHRPVWLACFVDPAAPREQAQRILLFPPPAEEMRVR